jgi:hypothetical protein
MFVLCQVQVSASDASIVHRIPTVYGVCECVREAWKAEAMTRRRAEAPQNKRVGSWSVAYRRGEGGSNTLPEIPKF